jgi:hypothetical protein
MILVMIDVVEVILARRELVRKFSQSTPYLSLTLFLHSCGRLPLSSRKLLVSFFLDEVFGGFQVNMSCIVLSCCVLYLDLALVFQHLFLETGYFGAARTENSTVVSKLDFFVIYSRLGVAYSIFDWSL